MFQKEINHPSLIEILGNKISGHPNTKQTDIQHRMNVVLKNYGRRNYGPGKEFQQRPDGTLFIISTT
jgi:hypothetical protein